MFNGLIYWVRYSTYLVKLFCVYTYVLFALTFHTPVAERRPPYEVTNRPLYGPYTFFTLNYIYMEVDQPLDERNDYYSCVFEHLSNIQQL